MIKRILYIMGVFMSGIIGAVEAQNITITFSSVKKVGDSVVIRFDAGLDKLPTNCRIVATPKLVNADKSLSLQAVVFAGRIRRIKDERVGYGYGNAIVVGKTNTLMYEYSIPFEEWMSGCDLIITTQLGVCGKEQLREITLRKDNLQKVVPPIAMPQFVASSEEETVEQITEVVSEKFPFAVPSDSYSYKPSKVDLENYRENGVAIYFTQGAKHIDTYYKDTTTSLNKIIVAVKYIMDNPELSLKKIVVMGASSIEGEYKFNLNLSKQRADDLVDYMKSELNLGDMSNVFVSHAIGEDWAALRDMINKSQMPYKREALSIINDYGVFEGREKFLMNLAGGIPYRYMEKHFFPNLRSASYIQVVYDIYKTNNVKPDRKK